MQWCFFWLPPRFHVIDAPSDLLKQECNDDLTGSDGSGKWQKPPWNAPENDGSPKFGSSPFPKGLCSTANRRTVRFTNPLASMPWWGFEPLVILKALKVTQKSSGRCLGTPGDESDNFPKEKITQLSAQKVEESICTTLFVQITIFF